MNRKISPLALLAAAASLAGCAQTPAPLPGGATSAAVFFTPPVRAARAEAGHVFRSQHAEYARRDAAVGVRRPSARAPLYPPRDIERSFVRYEQTRVIATDDGYRITERSRSSLRTRPGTGFGPHRRR